MILNKFRIISGLSIKQLGVLVLAIGLFSCKKTASENGNKSFVNVINTAYNLGAVNVSFDQIPLFASPLPYGQSSGTVSNPYDTTTAGVHDLQLFLGDTALLKEGNTALQQGAHYSLFVYDTMNRSTVNIIILQNDQGNRTDTFTTVRFMNFTPTSRIGLIVLFPRDTTGKIKASRRDTVIIPIASFVGSNPNPQAYKFNAAVHIGMNDVFSYIDSARPAIPNSAGIDSLNFRYLGKMEFDSTVNYNLFLQGFYDKFHNGTDPDSFRINSVRTN